LPLTRQAEKVLRITVIEAKAFKSKTVEIEHLMLSILKNTENPATQILEKQDMDYERFKKELVAIQGEIPTSEFRSDNDPDEFDDEQSKQYQQRKSSTGSGATKSKTPVLDNFGRDIT